MKLVSDLYNKAVSFKHNEKGSILPLTAIMITTLGLVAGAAVDYARYSNARTIMNTALDAAVLDAGKRLGAGQPVDQKFEDDFNTFFNVNIVGRGGFTNDYTVTAFSADADTGKVDASAQTNINATLMRIAGFRKLNAVTTSGGIFEQIDTEVTMMLDSTGSMRGSKIRALRAAASEAVDILLPDGANTRNTRVGIIPYASSVNADRYASTATKYNNTSQIASTDAFSNSNNNVPTSRCVTGRGGRDVATDTSYEVVPVGSDRRSTSNCPSSRILPLTNNSSELKAEIAGMNASGYTGGHLGIAWSYYMLSPKWNNLWDTENEPAAYSNDVNKVAILMTDGVFNTAYDGVGNADNAPFNNDVSKARSQSISAELCQNMKASGIAVYTIGFDLAGIRNATERANATSLLQNCATPSAGNEVFFYSADSEEELRETFRSIAENITSLRLTQ